MPHYFCLKRPFAALLHPKSSRYVIENIFSCSDLVLICEQQLQQAVEADAALVSRVGMSPDAFPALVENNPLTAIDVLLDVVKREPITECERACRPMGIER